MTKRSYQEMQEEDNCYDNCHNCYEEEYEPPLKKIRLDLLENEEKEINYNIEQKEEELEFHDKTIMIT